METRGPTAGGQNRIFALEAKDGTEGDSAEAEACRLR